MKRAGKGRIVTISSRAALAPSLTGIQSLCGGEARPARPGAPACARTRPIRHHGETVAPGFLRTSPDYEPQWEGWGPEGQKAFVERIAMRRMGSPEDIAYAAMFLASDYASLITGQILPVMGSPTKFSSGVYP